MANSNSLRVFILAVDESDLSYATERERVFVCDPDIEDPGTFTDRICRENGWMPLLMRFSEDGEPGAAHGSRLERETDVA